MLAANFANVVVELANNKSPMVYAEFPVPPFVTGNTPVTELVKSILATVEYVFAAVRLTKPIVDSAATPVNSVEPTCFELNVVKSAEDNNPRLLADDVGIFNVTVVAAEFILKSDPAAPVTIFNAPVNPLTLPTVPPAPTSVTHVYVVPLNVKY